jgi:hypothetical protein
MCIGIMDMEYFVGEERLNSFYDVSWVVERGPCCNNVNMSLG